VYLVRLRSRSFLALPFGGLRSSCRLFSIVFDFRMQLPPVSMSHGRLLVRNAAQLVTIVSDGSRFLAGKRQGVITIVPDGAVAVDASGKIISCGPTAQVLDVVAGWTFDRVVDATNKTVLPGLVDAHTHPVWAGDRSWEFSMKLSGASYTDVAARGGGIGYTVEHTRKATEDELLKSLQERIRRMSRFGTTTLEGKSGYGLDTETELKMLRVLHSAGTAPGRVARVVSNFCGAHAVPKGSTAEQATELIVNEMIPALKREKDAGLISPTMIDAFLEAGYFTAEQTRRIMAAGHAIGLESNFHGDELTKTAAGELAGDIGALSVSHLEYISAEGIAAMSKRPTFAVLLPTTAYCLRLVPPPARQIIDGNVPVALGSDYCPNAHCLSMPQTMNLACIMMHMTAEEALVAATINAAASIGVADRCGSIEVGKSGDLVLLNAPNWEHIVYQMVDPPIEAVFFEGHPVTT
jgi:imidazolonepropionase